MDGLNETLELLKERKPDNVIILFSYGDEADSYNSCLGGNSRGLLGLLVAESMNDDGFAEVLLTAAKAYRKIKVNE